jgi:hypothetical protein
VTGDVKTTSLEVLFWSVTAALIVESGSKEPLSRVTDNTIPAKSFEKTAGLSASGAQPGIHKPDKQKTKSNAEIFFINQTFHPFRKSTDFAYLGTEQFI